MRSVIVLAAFAAIIAAPSFAQTPTHSAFMQADHTMRAGKLIGMAVYNDQGEKIGAVDEILVTAGPVEPTVVVAAGAYLGAEKLFSEPLSHLKLAPGDKMMMPGATKATIMAKPSYRYQPGGMMGGGG